MCESFLSDDAMCVRGFVYYIKNDRVYCNVFLLLILVQNMFVFPSHTSTFLYI